MNTMDNTKPLVVEVSLEDIRAARDAMGTAHLPDMEVVRKFNRILDNPGKNLVAPKKFPWGNM